MAELQPDNLQIAPYPEDLYDLVGLCSYRPNWRVWLEVLDRGQGSEGLTLVIRVTGPNSYPPHNEVSVVHYFPVPPAAYNRASWQRWLFEQFLLVERHECMEWFTIDGVKPLAPNHGPGEDPYRITEPADDVARRTSFRGEVKDA